MISEEPPGSLADPHELLDAYLDFYRDTTLRKLDGLTEEQLRTSRVPSGWTPLELLVHLTAMEGRWFRWGFAAEPTGQPWADRGPDGAWQVPDGLSAEEVKARFTAQCARSRAIYAGVPLSRRAALGGRFATEAEAPTLAWIMFHVLQEYARHAGHLDIVRELSDGAVGE
jgi:hypothetical protein